MVFLQNSLRSLAGNFRAEFDPEQGIRIPEQGIWRPPGNPNASKHGELTHPTKIPRSLSSSEKVKVTEDVSTDALGFFSNAPPAVKFFLDDGTSGPLEGAVRSVLSMWETVLQIK
jgi:hypothetical protein